MMKWRNMGVVMGMIVRVPGVVLGVNLIRVVVGLRVMLLIRRRARVRM